MKPVRRAAFECSSVSVSSLTISRATGAATSTPSTTPLAVLLEIAVCTDVGIAFPPSGRPTPRRCRRICRHHLAVQRSCYPMRALVPVTQMAPRDAGTLGPTLLRLRQTAVSPNPCSLMYASEMAKRRCSRHSQISGNQACRRGERQKERRGAAVLEAPADSRRLIDDSGEHSGGRVSRAACPLMSTRSLLSERISARLAGRSRVSQRSSPRRTVESQREELQCSGRFRCRRPSPPPRQGSS
jgi:hypothetical protein